MDTEINTAKDGFQAGYEAVCPGLCEKIMSKCEWDLPTFYHKMKGIVPLNDVESRVVELIFNEYNLDPWTGEKI